MSVQARKAAERRELAVRRGYRVQTARARDFVQSASLGDAAPPGYPGASSSATFVELTGPSVTLTQGTHYLAKIVVTGLEGAFATTGAVASKLEELGFSHVAVYKSQVPAYFPDRTPADSGATFWAEGDFSAPNETKARPEEIARLWTTAGPAPAPSSAPLVKTGQHDVSTGAALIAAAVLVAIVVAGAAWAWKRAKRKHRRRRRFLSMRF